MRRLVAALALVVLAGNAEARLTYAQYQSLAGTSSGDQALAAWFDGLAAGLGYSYRDAKTRKLPTQWCVPSDFTFHHEQLRAVMDRFFADSVKSGTSYPADTPMESLVATALMVYYDCKKARM